MQYYKKKYTRKELETKEKGELIEIILSFQSPQKTVSNSSNPPSTYPKPSEIITPHWGGKKGHPARKKVRVEPDEIVVFPLERCPKCEKDLSICEEIDYSSQQQVEVEIRTKTVEYRRIRKYCSFCKQMVIAKAEPEITKGRFSPMVNALAVYFHYRQHIPHQRLVEMLNEVFGVSISKGSLTGILIRPTLEIRKFYQNLKEQLVNENVLGVDETGYRLCKANHWLWVFENFHLTFYTLEDNRSSRTLENVLGKIFNGTLVSDFFSAYNRIQAKKQKCNAHLLRELDFIIEKESDMNYAARLLELVMQAKELNDNRKNYTPEMFTCQVNIIHQKLGELMIEPLPVKSDSRRIQKRIIKYQSEIFRFLLDENIPFDNNGAEREIRVAVIHRKISNGFRTLQGADAFAQTLSFLQTQRKNNKNVFQTIKELYQPKPP